MFPPKFYIDTNFSILELIKVNAFPIFWDRLSQVAEQGDPKVWNGQTQRFKNVAGERPTSWYSLGTSGLSGTSFYVKKTFSYI